ncbi:GFA family protein [Sphingomonas crusticola]|uniref:GFA family protein n=1 Tax=Sphingomonas crusticola TaxID=1697973 RepID=UPI000E2525C3|nr:GFA family protein [Sphingomonas crusticola]
MTERTGGCACGAVRYRLASEPFDAGWCHCRTCQLSSGSPALAFATVPLDDFELVQGGEAVGRFASSAFGRRLFCTRCGTPLLMEVDHQPETLDFTIATLDRPDSIVPEFHIFYASRIGWAPAADETPRHDRFRTETRGLAPGQER